LALARRRPALPTSKLERNFRKLVAFVVKPLALVAIPSASRTILTATPMAGK